VSGEQHQCPPRPSEFLGRAPCGRVRLALGEIDSLSMATSGDPGDGTARRDQLVAWSREVFAAAGLEPTPEQVTEIAKSIGGLLLLQRLVPFAADQRVQTLSDGRTLFEAWVAGTQVGPPNVLARWDELCETLVQMVVVARAADDDPSRGRVEAEVRHEINDLIDRELEDARAEFVQGVSEEFGAHAGARTTTGAASAAGGGCLLMVLALGASAVAITGRRSSRSKR
jgi:hypothetical protein